MGSLSLRSSRQGDGDEECPRIRVGTDAGCRFRLACGGLGWLFVRCRSRSESKNEKYKVKGETFWCILVRAWDAKMELLNDSELAAAAPANRASLGCFQQPLELR
jgi:hypothetical protein